MLFPFLLIAVCLAGLLIAGWLKQRQRKLIKVSGYRETLDSSFEPDRDSVHFNGSVEGESELKESFLGRRIHSVGWTLLALFVPIVMGNFIIGVLSRYELLDPKLSTQILQVTLPVAFIVPIAGLAPFWLLPGMLRLQRCERSELSSRTANDLDGKVRDLESFGFQFVGYAKKYMLSNKSCAYLLSPDRKCLAEIVRERGKTGVMLHGIAKNGWLYIVGTHPEITLCIDGRELNLPTLITVGNEASPKLIIDEFNELASQFEDRGLMSLCIPEAEIFHAVHYATIISSWWAYKRLLRFVKPEPIPTADRVVKYNGSIPTFGFRRSAELDNAF